MQLSSRQRFNCEFIDVLHANRRVCGRYKDEGTMIVIRQYGKSGWGIPSHRYQKLMRIKQKFKGMMTWDHLTLSAYDKGKVLKIK